MKSFLPWYQNGNDFLEQWERVVRWYAHVESIRNNHPYTRIFSVEEQEDFILAYFFNLVCLKDWLKKVNGDDGLEKLFDKKTGVESLKIIGDFTNNYKHFSNNSPRVNNYTWLVSRDAQVGDLAKATHTWWIISGNKKFNLYDLADDSYREVEKYFRQKGYQ